MRADTVNANVLSGRRAAPAGQVTYWRYVRYYLPLGLCLLITVGIRLWLVVRTHGFIDGDEALVGIQAQHILHGEFPAYYYGQPYMGSLEAYLIALLFAIAGSSTWAMRCEPILLSLVLVWLTWRLAGALASEARLPESARRWFMVVSTSFAAIPPLYDGIIELRTWGGHIETYIVSMSLLLAALRLTQCWQARASLGETTWRWAGFGLLVGLGMWVYPLIIIAVLTALLWIGLAVVKMPFPVRKDRSMTSRITIWPHLVLAIAAIPTCLAGFAPALLWGASHRWANVLYLFNPNNEDSQNALLHQLYPDRLSLLRGKITLYGQCIAPRVIGGALPNISPNYALLQASVGIIVIVSCLGLLIWACFRPTPLLRQVRGLVGLPLLFAVGTALVFCASNISAAGLLFPCSRDEVGRYAAPLVLALPFLFAALITAVYSYRSGCLPLGEEHDQGDSAEVTTQKRGTFKLVEWILIACIVIYLAAQALTYVRVSQDYTFQSFACQIAPIDDGPIVEYMQKKHIRYAWGTVWIGNALVFKTGGKIIVADPRIITVHANNRIPANTLAVQQAARPAVLAFALHSDEHPELLKALDAQRVAYTVVRFPSVHGLDVLLVQPDRTLSPFTANALGAWFYNC